MTKWASAAWPAETMAVVRALFAQGLSCSQIGDRLEPKRSRNAVIGIIHRSGMSRTPEAKAMHAGARAAAQSRRMQEARLKAERLAAREAAGQLKAPQPPRPAALRLINAPPPADLTGCKPLLALTHGECRYPVAGERADALFCAKASAGPWCAEHDRLCHAPTVTPARRRAAEGAAAWFARRAA